MGRPERRIAAVVGLKDEADLLPRTIEQLRRIGVGYIIVMDFGSTDGSLEYLAEAEAAGDIWVLHRDEPAPRGLGRRWTVALARASEADWVLFLDADELVLPKSGSLHDLADLDTADVLAVMRYNVVATADGPSLPDELDPEAYDRLLLYAQPIPDFYRHVLREPDTPWIRGVLEPKIMLRPRALVDLHPGSHDADLTADRPWRRAIATDVIIAHVPIRSGERFAMRASNYAKAVAGRPDWYTGWQGWQWVRFATAADTGRTDDEYRRQLVDGEELARLRASLVVRSARDVFDDPIPAVGSEALHREMAWRAEPWLWATGLVCRQEGIAPGGKIELMSGQARTPAVFVPPDSVVKLHARWSDGHDVARREAATLRRLEAVVGSRREGPPLPVPRLRAEGTLGDAYRYLVMTRVRGTPLEQLEAIEGPAERDALPDALGGFVRWLHAVPVHDAERDAEWKRFVGMVVEARARAVRTWRERGLLPTLADELDAWLPGVDELAGSPDGAVLCHGELDASNLMGWMDGRRFVPTGVIDLARAFTGHPLAEIGPIWWSALERDPGAFGRFASAAHLRREDDPGLARMLLAWALLRPGDSVIERTALSDVTDLAALAVLWFGPAETSVAPAGDEGVASGPTSP